MLLNSIKATALVLAVLTTQAQAQQSASATPAVFYKPVDLVGSLHRNWFAPQAAHFARQSNALTTSMASFCSATASPAAIDAVRSSWKASASAWDTLSGVQIGPLLQRRSARQIDFMPTRPALIARAIEAAPANARAMESTGTPAKGLPALEWLLWSQPLAPATPACAYAVQLAADVQREADALSTAFGELAAGASDAEDSDAPALAEFVNQWTGAIERLRWAEIEKPRLAGATGRPGARGVDPKNAAVFARSASGQTAERWAASWRAVRTLAVGVSSPGTAAPALNNGVQVSLEDYLRGLGHAVAADKLVRGIAEADEALQKLAPGDTAGIKAATRSLANLKKVVEADIAPAVDITIGFSDADGD